MQLDNSKLKQSVFIIALFALGGFLFWDLREFLSAFLGSVVFYIILRRPYFYLTEKAKRKWNKYLATALLITLSFVVLVLPIFLISLMISTNINFLIHHYEGLLQMVQKWSSDAKENYGIDLLSGESVSKLTGLATTILPGILSATAKALLDIVVLYFVLFFMLVNSRILERQVKEYLPFHQKNNQLLVTELRKQTIANSIGIGVLAVIQGLAATLGYVIFGVSQPGLWGAITGLAGAIPVFGTGIAWVPVCVILYVSGQHNHAIYLAIYSTIVLATIEHVFRLLVIKKIGDVHPLITFFGVFMGIDLFGIVGVIFGPLLISYFILLLRIYRNEYLGIES